MEGLNINLIKSSDLTYLDNKECFVAVLEGDKMRSIGDFLHEVGTAFDFPDYYGENMNAFYECINDLSWIAKPNYALVIKGYCQFLANEPNGTSKEFLLILDKITKEWKNVPNYSGEEEFRGKADFKVFVVGDEKAIEDLNSIKEGL